MAYQGSHRHTVDSATGRVAIPSRFRKLTSEKANGAFVIMRGLDKCLCLYPSNVWRKDTRRLKSLPYTKKSVRRLRRRLFGESEEVTLDDQGRVIVPKHLLDYAEIDNEAVIVGAADVIEIWSPELYKRMMEESDKTVEQDLEEIEAIEDRQRRVRE
ncbi:hypothetical protein AMJ40_04715 [candidate division TA06 bacterium DG_26]|uniref:Transcriptional regulator MraZ n=1 Tax=candidate division TA06 bacterium DG_26 TaxID=1703771 RepID=A0A0S7WI40_UNCT6|nr:MAG: hypothetical protein AMJ40_04715 [candidate division TA06 bacterium DG_26]